MNDLLFKITTHLLKEPNELNVGECYNVYIIQETLYGYFVKYREIKGLIHKSKVDKALKIGQRINATLIGIKEQKGRKLYSFSLITNSPSAKYAKTIKQGESRIATIISREKTKMIAVIEETNLPVIIADNRFYYFYRRTFKDGDKIKIMFKQYNAEKDKLYFALDGWKLK